MNRERDSTAKGGVSPRRGMVNEEPLTKAD